MRKLLVAGWVVLILALMIGALEFGLRTFMGFGNPVLYDNTYAWGYRPLPNQEVRRTARKRIRINNLGLRARRDWPQTPVPGELRLLYLGDSVIYGGSYVDDTETFAEASADRLSRALGRPVLPGNAGVNGWGPKNIAGLVQAHGCFQADVVVVVALEADLERDLSHVTEMPFWNHKPSSAIEEVLSSYVAYKFSNRRYLRKDVFVPAAERDSFYRQSLSLYVEIGRRARESGAVPVMVWHPMRAAAMGVQADAHREAFLSMCREAGLATIDLLPLMRAQRDPARFYVDLGHLGVEGHALYGGALGDSLARVLKSPA